MLERPERINPGRRLRESVSNRHGGIGPVRRSPASPEFSLRRSVSNRHAAIGPVSRSPASPEHSLRRSVSSREAISRGNRRRTRAPVRLEATDPERPASSTAAGEDPMAYQAAVR